jgi:hypothetical protein
MHSSLRKAGDMTAFPETIEAGAAAAFLGETNGPSRRPIIRGLRLLAVRRLPLGRAARQGGRPARAAFARRNTL